jgi:hypothetical protein
MRQGRSRRRINSHHSGGLRRSALRLAVAFLSVSRRSISPRDGMVGRRVRGGGANAPRSTDTRRAAAASRLRSCERCSEAETTSTPSVSRSPRRDTARSRRNGGIDGLVATSNDNSTLLSVVLTPCPPGPLDRENRHRSSEAGTVTRGVTMRSDTTSGTATIIPAGATGGIRTLPAGGAQRPKSASRVSHRGCMLVPC